MDKILVLIDGANIKHTANQLNMNIDWKRFTKPFTVGVTSLDVGITAIYEDGAGHIHLKQLVDYLGTTDTPLFRRKLSPFPTPLGKSRSKETWT